MGVILGLARHVECHQILWQDVTNIKNREKQRNKRQRETKEQKRQQLYFDRLNVEKLSIDSFDCDHFIYRERGFLSQQETGSKSVGQASNSKNRFRNESVWKTSKSRSSRPLKSIMPCFTRETGLVEKANNLVGFYQNIFAYQRIHLFHIHLNLIMLCK